MIARVALALLGVAMAGYGVVLLLTRQDADQVVDAVLWLVGGVVVHDGIVVPVVLLLVVLGMRALPASYRSPAAVALVVLGPLTLLAVPVLGRFGARPDNPTLLDRPYVTSWSGLVVVGVVAVVVAGRVVRSRHGGARTSEHRGRGDGRGTRAGGR